LASSTGYKNEWKRRGKEGVWKVLIFNHLLLIKLITRREKRDRPCYEAQERKSGRKKNTSVKRENFGRSIDD